MNLLTMAVFGYPLILIGIGVWRSRQINSHADFMVASRNVPVALLVGTLICTWIGSGSLFGGAGLAYRTGLAALWFSSGAWVGLLVAFYLAPRVRSITQYTVPDLLEQRYNSAARILASVAIILAYVTIAAYQFRGGGWILSIVTDGAISPTTGMYIAAATIVLFTALAGMVSIVSVDLLNGIIIVLGIVIGLPYLVFSNGGLGEIAAGLPEGHLTILGGHNFLWVLGVALPTLLLILGESGMYQKFFSAKDTGSAKKAVVGMFIGVVFIETALALLAIVGRAVFPELTDPAQVSLVGRAASETVILYIAANGLPVVGGAILLAAAVAIVFSTGNTFLLVPSTNVSRDLYERFVDPDASDGTKLWVQRFSIVLFGALGLFLVTQFDSVLAMALYAYSLVGASLTPALLAAFLWRRVTPQGGVACIAGGIGSIVGITFLSRLGVNFSVVIGEVEFDLASSDYIVIPGVIISLGLLTVVSLLTPPSPKEKWAPFFRDPKGSRTSGRASSGRGTVG